MPASTFLAKYPGKCANCPAPIQPEQECTYTADHLITHVDCEAIDAEQDTALRGRVCPHCFLEMPLSGVCDDCG